MTAADELAGLLEKDLASLSERRALNSHEHSAIEHISCEHPAIEHVLSRGQRNSDVEDGSQVCSVEGSQGRQSTGTASLPSQ